MLLALSSMVPITTQFQWLQVIDGVIGICPPSIWHPFMEMAGKQFSPFMEQLVQPCLTACATASYGLWKWLASNSPVYGNGCATMYYGLYNYVLHLVQLCLIFCATMSYGLWKWLCNCVLHFVQLRLTACATASYGLWKWLASSAPIYGNGFRRGTSENQRLHKKLGNSENRVTYRFR